MPTITSRETWLTRGLLGYWLGSALGRSWSFCLDTKYTSPKVSNSSHLVSPNAPINMRRGMYNVDVPTTFRVPLTTISDLDVSTKDIEVGKHKELLSGMTNDKRKAVMDALVVMCDSIQATNTIVDAIPYVVSHVDDSTIVDALVGENLNVDESPIVHSIFIQDKPNSYIAAARGSRPKPSVARGSKLDPSISKANFHSLFLENLCVGVNVSIPRMVVETVSTRFANTLYRYFIGLEDVLENGPWMICNSSIILKKWFVSTHISKEELTCSPVWVKIHDVPIQVFSKDGLSIIASQISKPNMLDQYTFTMCIESWGRSSFAHCLIEINADDVLKESLTIDVHLIEDMRYEPKATTSAPNKGATNLGNTSKSSFMKNQPLKDTITSTKEGKIKMSNSYAALEEESDEDVENVYDESANLLYSKTGESSSTFTTVAG
nr:hypothetical protein [Tanacetum cinerariifolium]